MTRPPAPPSVEGLWEGLNPPYRTIVADPPWAYDDGWPMSNGAGQRGNKGRKALGYSAMSVIDMAAMPITPLVDVGAHLWLWTTNRYLRASFDLVNTWGFRHSQTLIWCKTPRGIGPGGAFSNTTEFVLFCRHGSLKPLDRIDTTWFNWPRGAHSEKPPAFFDLVERVSPGPRVELFARQPRLGWDHWGHGIEGAA